MKKVLLALVMAVIVISAKAQTTMNVRAGYGYNTDAEGVTGIFQVNMPFKTGSRWTFSPSLQLDMAIDPYENKGSQNILIPLFFGYKTPIGDKLLFFPKIGPAVGYDTFSESSAFNYGPSVELAFEYKHFVVAANGYFSIKGVERYEDTGSFYDGYYHTSLITKHPNIYTASLTLGYKF